MELLQNEIIRRAALPTPGTDEMAEFIEKNTNPYVWVDDTLASILK